MGWFTDLLTPRAAHDVRSPAEIAALTAPDERRQFYSETIPSNSAGYASYSGEIVSERTALQEMAVLSCVRLLSDTIAGLPLDVGRSTGAVRTPLPSPAAISQPDPEITGFEHAWRVIQSQAVRGNSYEQITAFDKYEYPLSRKCIHPDQVRVSRNYDDGGADYTVHGVPIPRTEMIHIRRFPVPGQLTGLSPIEQARHGIGLSLAARRYGGTWFGDSADPSSVLETEANLSDEESARVMKGWISSHGGRRHPAMLSGGLTYRAISITPEESQFLATRAYERSEIAMLYGIPPHMIGDTAKSTSWGTGIEQQSIGFVRYTLLPWLRCIEDAYSWRLLKRGQSVKFNVAGLLRADLPTRYQAYTLGRNGGWLNSDEIRAWEDMDPIPGGLGQDFLQPLNYAPLGTTPAAAAPPPDAGDPASDPADDPADSQ